MSTPPPHPSVSSWSKVRELAAGALELPAAERSAFLEAECRGDEALRKEVEAIVRADERAGAGFLRPLTMDLPAAGPQVPTATDPPAAGWLIGKRIGHYRVKRLIAAGGMGAVYEAVQENPRRLVALKVMRPGLGLASPLPGTAMLRRFEHEAQVLGRLRHRGIAQVYEAGVHETESGSIPYFAMEYITSGQPITVAASARRLSVRERLELFAQVCEAVQHGHQKGVVHRDLKPGNILVDGALQPKVIDFGVARVLGGIDADPPSPSLSFAETGAGQLVGTLAYMSPEQVGGVGGGSDQRDVDVRTDVYSLGVVLYELLTGRVPHDVSSASLPEAARMIRESPPVPPGRVDRALKGDLQTITLKALEKDRERRYQSAAELRADIERYLNSQPIFARPPTVLYQLRLLARRRRGLMVASAAMVVGAAVGVGGLALGLVNTIAERDRAKDAELRAQEEAKRSDRIAGFLKSMIGAGAAIQYAGGIHDEADDPLAEMAVPGEWRESPRQARTVVELLMQSGARLKGEPAPFPDDPLVAAELGELIGTALAQQGADGAAGLQWTLELRMKHQGPDHPDTVRTRLRLGFFKQGGGDYAGAGMHFRAAYESRQRTLGEGDPLTLRAGRRVAENLNWMGQPVEALSLAQRLYEVGSAAHGASNRYALEALATVAECTLQVGDVVESERLAREAYEGLRRLGEAGRAGGTPPQAPPPAMVIVRAGEVLASALEIGDRAAEAVELRRASLDVSRSVYGAESPRLLFPEIALAAALAWAEEWEEAIAVQRSALDRARENFGWESNAAYRNEYTLARYLSGEWKGGDSASLEEAERLALHAYEGHLRHAPAEDPVCLLYGTMCATIARQRGRVEEAEQRARSLIAHAEPLGWWAWFIYREHGLCLEALGHREEAAIALKRAAALLERRVPANRRQWRELAMQLSRFYGALAEGGEAGAEREAAHWRGEAARVDFARPLLTPVEK